MPVITDSNRDNDVERLLLPKYPIRGPRAMSTLKPPEAYPGPSTNIQRRLAEFRAMAVLYDWVQVPRPKAFFYCISLRTGVEMISLSVLFNKVAGIFGLLAILTGYTLNATQISMYLYSITALILVAYLMPYIREQSPLECLALAWFYTLDTVINSVYTATFSLIWFMTGVKGSISSSADDIAGFTLPKHNGTKTDVSSSSVTGILNGKAAATVDIFAATNSTPKGIREHSSGSLTDSAPSLIIIIALTILRVYFVLIMMAYARRILRRYKNTTPSTAGRMSLSSSSDQEGNPFATSMPAGQGWRGKLGRVMLLGWKHYFLSDRVEDDWEKGLNERFRQVVLSETRGPSERERRARSGPGRPTPPPNATKSPRPY